MDSSERAKDFLKTSVENIDKKCSTREEVRTISTVRKEARK